MSVPEVIVNRGDARLLAQAVAARLVTRLVDSVAARGTASVVLTGGGIVAFTVETQEDDSDGVALGEKLRYRHGADHVRAAIAAAGLEIVELAPASTRNEAGDAVPGLVAVAVRPGEAECQP